MDDFNPLEEPPPIHRPEPVATRRKWGVFSAPTSRAPSPSAPSAPTHPRSRDSDMYARDSAKLARDTGVYARDTSSYTRDASSYARDTSSYARDTGSYARDTGSYARDTGMTSRDSVRPASGPGVLLLPGLLVVVLLFQVWQYFGVRGDVRELRKRVEEAQTSLNQVWESAKGLDQDRMERVALLADSIRTVFDYAQGQIQLWSQRLDENDRATSDVNARLAGFATTDQVQRSRLESLERQSRTTSTAFEALSRRAQAQEASVREVSALMSSVRGSLSRLDADLATLERKYEASATTNGMLNRRVESVSAWAEGFRRAGLSADAVERQFAALSDDLRRVRMRVDSLRSSSRVVTSSAR